jgi:16S rRNA (guanine527-N7)-methyltransferase
MTATLGSLAFSTAEALGIPLDADARGHLITWLARLEEWNARIDLTAARTPEQLVDLMLADALVLAGQLPERATLLDVGTGAGAPGLPLALIRPDLRVTLVEPLGKRASFLRMVIGEVDRPDVCIERTRAERLRPLRSWDVAVSRATMRPAAWLDLATRLVAPGGTVWVLLAREGPPIHAQAEVETDIAYTWPLTGARRRALGYRVRDTRSPAPVL